MARNLNIEVTRLARTRHTALLCAVCALALFLSIGALPSTLALYSAVDEDRHVLVFEESGDVNVSLTEQLFDENAALGLSAGSTIVKDPVLKNNKGDAYARVFMQIRDTATGAVLDPGVEADALRLEKILGAIWSDPQGKLEPGTAYSKAEIEAMEGVEPVYNSASFKEAAVPFNETAQAYVIEHDGVLRSGESASLFDRICIPADYSSGEVALMGDYSIVLWGQAIQVDGFADQASALAALSDEFHFGADGKAEGSDASDAGGADAADASGNGSGANAKAA